MTAPTSHQYLEALKVETNSAEGPPVEADQKSGSTTQRALEHVLAQREKEIALLKDSELRLREIILDKTGSQEVTDDDIRSNFLKVRRGVQRIVSKSMSFGENKTTKEEPANVPQIGSRMEFYDYLSGLERKDRALQVRARVFRMLNARILSAKRFGLEQTQLESADGSKMDGEDIGIALADFEEGLIAAKVPGPIIADWRVGTLKCVSHLFSAVNKTPASKIVRSVVDDVLAFLDPIIAPDITEVQLQDLENEVAQLCEVAYHLRMDMRASKEEYAIWIPNLSKDSDEQLLQRVAEFADSFGVDGGKSGDGSDQIAYTLFGGLVKHPEHRAEGLTTLEKAQVVMRRK